MRVVTDGKYTLNVSNKKQVSVNRLGERQKMVKANWPFLFVKFAILKEHIEASDW